MSLVHQFILYLALGLLGSSLILPGIMEFFKAQAGNSHIMAMDVDGKNQFRALNAMMLGVGCMAFWSCIELEQSRNLVLALGGILLIVANARLYSYVIDGTPGYATLLYTAVEVCLALLFIIWPPHQ